MTFVIILIYLNSVIFLPNLFGVAFYIYLIDVLFNNLEGNGTLQSPPGVVAACVWTIIYKTTNKGKTEAMISVK